MGTSPASFGCTFVEVHGQHRRDGGCERGAGLTATWACPGGTGDSRTGRRRAARRQRRGRTVAGKNGRFAWEILYLGQATYWALLYHDGRWGTRGSGVIHWLPKVWNGGNSLLGLLGGLGGRGLLPPRRGGLGGRGRLADWAARPGGMGGGHHAWRRGPVRRRRPDSPAARARDGARPSGAGVGAFVPAGVCAESLYQWLRTGRGYHDNRFEAAARRDAGEEN